MNRLEQKRTDALQVFPAPRPGAVVTENPPALVWLKEEGCESYRVTLMSGDRIVWETETTSNTAVPDVLPEPGEYQWNIVSGDRERGWQSFTLSENAPVIRRPDPKALLDAVPDERPRHLFLASDVPDILRKHTKAVETLKRTVQKAMEDGLPVPPMFHRDPDALPYREYFGRHRDFIDRDLVALSLAHVLLKDEEAGVRAKELLLTVCDWNSEGPCSLETIWGDELGLSHARCLPAVFDLCWDLLDEKQRKFVARTVALYAAQCERMLRRLDFTNNPGFSHSGRIPAYMGEAALVLKGTDAVPEETLIRWLTLATEIYGGMFPFFGGTDGGWAEGTFYASSYTKWYLPFFSAVERYTGCSYLSRPFYRNYPVYLQHFFPPDWEIHPFCDGYWIGSPEDPEWPGFLAQNPYHIYAERFGSPLLKKWSRESEDQPVFLLHLLDVFLPEGEEDPTAPGRQVTRAAAFPETGYVSLHTDPEHPDSELALVARSSPYGTASHQHADQGSFCLMAGGTAIISPSGYFGRKYGTKHHLEYTKSSQAHNTLLVDGRGQPTHSREAEGTTGKVLGAWDRDGLLTAAVEPSGAYREMESWTRSFLLREDFLEITDRVRLKAPGKLSWLAHTLSRPEAKGESALLERNGWRAVITPLEGNLSGLTVSDRFSVDLNEGEPEQYHVQMPPQYHLKWETPVQTEFTLRVRISVEKVH